MIKGIKGNGKSYNRFSNPLPSSELCDGETHPVNDDLILFIANTEPLQLWHHYVEPVL